MTRINTNVSSLVAQNVLGRSNASLEQALTRLSTGLRINTGKDDPAGLIASENLRTDITSIRKAIGNTDRANQVIATADSALGQVSSLLNDIRGLVTESANSGALSDQQLAANQLQVDSSLEALNRIAQTTTFQGRRLLDGSLDFITSAGTNYSSLSNLQIDQANLGATGSVSVSVSVNTAATKGSVSVANIPASVAAGNSQGSIEFADAAEPSGGTVGIATLAKSATGNVSLTNGVISITAGTAGAAGNTTTLNVDIIDTTTTLGAAYVSGTNTITVRADITNDAANWTVDDISAAINGLTEFNSAVVSGGTGAGADETINNQTLAGGTDAVTQNITVVGEDGADSNVSIQVLEFAGIGSTPTVTGDADSGYVIRVDNAGNTTLAAIATAIQSIGEVATATAATPGAVYNGTTDSSLNGTGITTNLTGGTDAGSDIITITADTAGAFNRTLVFNDTANLGDDVINVTDDGTTITVQIDDTSTYSLTALATAITGQLTGFTATLTANNGNGQYDAATDTAPTGGEIVSLTGGQAGSGGITSSVVLELAGAGGAEVLSFGVGTSLTELIAGINLVKDATGVEASINGTTPTTLDLTSTTYGSNGVVDIKVISEGAGATPSGVFSSSVGQGTRNAGADIVASINGVVATGNGNSLSINTATLDLSTTVTAGFTGDINFTITGGGALFQLGADVVSNQQARLGIGSVNTARLGGVSGKLFQLGTGGTATLASDPTIAASIIEEAIDQVTLLRGRLGAFQRTSLETNKAALNDTLVNLTDAESNIRDADFAEETANLTRAQILVQSGTTILSIANQNPQNVLALLR
ncbi:MAG: flagellin [Pirellulales bacterium]